MDGLASRLDNYFGEGKFAALSGATPAIATSHPLSFPKRFTDSVERTAFPG